VSDAWRALTAESALEPDIPLCDPHHHLWEYPGSRYLADDFVGEFAGHRIEHTVFVECLQHYRTDGPEPLRPVGETEWVEEVARGTDRIADGPRLAAGIVAFADLTLGAAVGEVLDAHLAASRRVRAVRYATAWDASEQIRPSHTHPPAGLMGRADFRAGFSELIRRDLAFDAWLYPAQFGELASLAGDFPEARIVLDHMGGPLGVGPYAGRRQAVLDDWRRGLETVAARPNVFVKLGGQTMTSAGFGWHKRPAPPGSVELSDAFRPYFDACIELFGASRCMLESNFPMDRASCSYGVLWNAFKRVTSGRPRIERLALLGGTAMNFYRLSR